MTCGISSDFAWTTQRRQSTLQGSAWRDQERRRERVGAGGPVTHGRVRGRRGILIGKSPVVETMNWDAGRHHCGRVHGGLITGEEWRIHDKWTLRECAGKEALKRILKCQNIEFNDSIARVAILQFSLLFLCMARRGSTIYTFASGVHVLFSCSVFQM